MKVENDIQTDNRDREDRNKISEVKEGSQSLENWQNKIQFPSDRRIK